MRVRAKERLYFGQVFEEGDEFDVPDDTVMKDAPFEKITKGKKSQAVDTSGDDNPDEPAI